MDTRKRIPIGVSIHGVFIYNMISHITHFTHRDGKVKKIKRQTMKIGKYF